MALPTQVAADKTGSPPITETDTDGLIYIKMGPIRIYFGTGSPDNEVTAPDCSLFFELGETELWMKDDADATAWVMVGDQAA